MPRVISDRKLALPEIRRHGSVFGDGYFRRVGCACDGTGPADPRLTSHGSRGECDHRACRIGCCRRAGSDATSAVGDESQLERRRGASATATGSSGTQFLRDRNCAEAAEGIPHGCRVGAVSRIIEPLNLKTAVETEILVEPVEMTGNPTAPQFTFSVITSSFASCCI